MNNLYQLSDYELTKLQNIDPILSDDWQIILSAIFPKLNKDSQLMVLKDILEPRGLVYDHISKKFFINPPKNLLEVCQARPIHNKQLLKAVEEMTEFLSSAPPPPTILRCNIIG